MAIRFPTNPYEDVLPSEFNKSNKKHASEFFIAENFKRYGWFVYEPFTDTGIDRIIQKKVCPDGHTEYIDDTRQKKQCSKCSKDLMKITRFVQIKTRELKDHDGWKKDKYKYFGFTLSSADFKTDPRYVFLLYSDNTTKEDQDVLIIPISDFFAFFTKHKSLGQSFFSTTSFRQGNGKINDLNYNLGTKSWVYHPTKKSEINLDEFVNESGLKKISDLRLDNEFQTVQEKLTEQKLALYFDPVKWNKNVKMVQPILDGRLQKDYPEKLKIQRKEQLKSFKKKLPKDLKTSIGQGYLIKFKELRDFAKEP